MAQHQNNIVYNWCKSFILKGFSNTHVIKFYLQFYDWEC